MILVILLTCMVGGLLTLWYTNNLKISIPPNSVIYDVLLYFEKKKGIQYNYTWESVRITTGSTTIFLPYSRDWLDVKIGVYQRNGDFIDCSLPPGTILNMSPAQIDVSKIVLEKNGKKYTFIEDEIPNIPSEVEEI